MDELVKRTILPAIIGRRVLFAYSFIGELDAHGIVLGLDDGSDISIEFHSETRIAAEVFRSASEDDEATVITAPD